MTPSRPQNQGNVNVRSINPSISNQRPGAKKLEETWTKFPNFIIEALYNRDVSPGMSEYETRIFLFIARVTWGWGRPYAKITHRDFVTTTKIDRRSCIRSINSLFDKGMILKKGSGKGETHYYGINQDTSKWVDKNFAKKELSKLSSIF